MNDLIGRQKAIDAINKYIGTFDAIDVNFLDGLKAAMGLLKNLPSECNVIYCRDCMFYSGHRCQAIRSLDDWRSQDDYCSRAEERMPDSCPPCGTDMRGEQSE